MVRFPAGKGRVCRKNQHSGKEQLNQDTYWGRNPPTSKKNFITIDQEKGTSL